MLSGVRLVTWPAEVAGRGRSKAGDSTDPLDRLRKSGTDYSHLSDSELTALVAEGEAQAAESED